jgi:3-oxoadipate enol-lactonase/4-carboxymuconolactone decarboxylase
LQTIVVLSRNRLQNKRFCKDKRIFGKTDETAHMLLATDDGATLDIADEGRGTPIVLIHPFPFSKEIWNDVAGTLSSRARVLRFDLRGSGKSSSPPGPYLMETLAGDLADVLDARGTNRAVVAGNSIGVMVALAFYRMFAERVLGLALICGRASADAPHVANERRSLADAIERQGVSPLVDAYRNRLSDGACALMERVDPRGAAALLRGMALRSDANDVLGDIEVPTRVIAGSQDSLVSQEELRELARKTPGARFDLLECGHLPPLEAPAALARLLGDLLDDVEAGGAAR